MKPMAAREWSRDRIFCLWCYWGRTKGACLPLHGLPKEDKVENKWLQFFFSPIPPQPCIVYASYHREQGAVRCRISHRLQTGSLLLC